MPVKRHLFPMLGFVVSHTPGIARAWRYEFPDGSSLLVTDLEGFDLPHPDGPYAVLYLSPRDELLEVVSELQRPKDVYRFVRRKQRLVAWRLSPPSSI